MSIDGHSKEGDGCAGCRQECSNRVKPGAKDQHEFDRVIFLKALPGLLEVERYRDKFFAYFNGEQMAGPQDTREDVIRIFRADNPYETTCLVVQVLSKEQQKTPIGEVVCAPLWGK